MSTSVIVEPGEYPVYWDDGAVYWLMTGRLNSRGGQKIGDGMFVMGGGDRPHGPDVTFPSRSYGPEQFADFLREEVCVEGPAQRLRFEVNEKAIR